MESRTTDPSRSAWIVLDLRVHAGWNLHDDLTTHAAWHSLRDELKTSRHRLISWSNGGEQGLLYVVTDDGDGFVELARRCAPGAGIESFVAKIWDTDPRASDSPPREIPLAQPHAPWPNPGHAVELLERSLEAIARGPGVSPN